MNCESCQRRVASELAEIRRSVQRYERSEDYGHVTGPLLSMVARLADLVELIRNQDNLHHE